MTTDEQRGTKSWQDRFGGLTRIEARSSDYVPQAERHGKVWHQGPFWFMAEAELLTLASGFVGGSLGLSLAWSLLSIALGAGVGALFVVSHGMQGPRLGLPQMIQSRAQFGRRGSVIPSGMVVFMYVGFTVFDAIMLAQIGGTFGIRFTISAIVAIVLAVLIALVGHDFRRLTASVWLRIWFVTGVGVILAAEQIADAEELAAAPAVAAGQSHAR